MLILHTLALNLIMCCWKTCQKTTKDKDWLTVLPNGTEQPVNFFKELTALTGYGDPIGKLSTSHFIGVIERKYLTKGHHVSGNVVVINTKLNEVFYKNKTKSELEEMSDMQVKIDPSIERDTIVLVVKLKNKGIRSISEMKKMGTRVISLTFNMF